LRSSNGPAGLFLHFDKILQRFWHLMCLFSHTGGRAVKGAATRLLGLRVRIPLKTWIFDVVFVV
jgi:hypothetical protein